MLSAVSDQLTKFYKGIRSDSGGYLAAIALRELLLQLLQIAEGQPLGEGLLTDGHITDISLDRVAGDKMWKEKCNAIDARNEIVARTQLDVLQIECQAFITMNVGILSRTGVSS